MAIVRWEPLRDIGSIQTDMNRLFNSLFDEQATPSGGRRWVPAMDLVEGDGEYVLRADLPGLSREDIAVEVDGNVLTVSGERSSERSAEDEGYFRVERAHGSFSRALTLPEGVDPKAVVATVEKGVLEVRIPKPEQRRPHRVEIAGGGGGHETIEGSES